MNLQEDSVLIALIGESVSVYVDELTFHGILRAVSHEAILLEVPRTPTDPVGEEAHTPCVWIPAYNLTAIRVPGGVELENLRGITG